MGTEETARIIRIGTSETSKAPHLNLEDTKPHVFRVATAQPTPISVKLVLEEPTISSEDTQKTRIGKSPTQPSTPIPEKTRLIKPASPTAPGDTEQTRAVRVVTNDATLPTPVVLPESAALEDTQPIKVTEKPPPTTPPQPTVSRPEVTAPPAQLPTENVATTIPKGPMQPETAVPLPATPESTQKFPKEDEFETMLNERSRGILGKIRWQLNNDDRIADGEFRLFNPKEKLDGLMRGSIAEQYSEILPISDAATVFSTGENVSDISLTTFKTQFGVNVKHKILEKVVRKSLVEKPVSLRNLGEALTPEDADVLVEEIVYGYSAKQENFPNAGILYEESTIPDGVLQNGQGEIVGFSEVKAYLPEEFDGLIEKLPDQLPNEITFIDNIRTVGFGNKALRDDMPMLLRFPSDIPDASLQSLRQRLQEHGFTNVLIQKMPLTSRQIAQESKKFVQSNLERIKDGTLGVPPEGIELFQWYAEQPETLVTTILTPETSPLLHSGQQIVEFIGDRESNFDGIYQDRLRELARQLTAQASAQTQRTILTQLSVRANQMERSFLNARGAWDKLNVGYAKQLQQMIGQALEKLPK